MDAKILIVDDKAENLVALRKVLSPLGAIVLEASSGDEALALSLQHNFALAILDVQMPYMDGYELAEFLRQESKTSTLPIIFVSAIYSDDWHVFKGYEAGAVDFLSKPFNPSQLLAKVNVFLMLHQQKEYYRGKLDQLGTSLKVEKDRVTMLQARSQRYRNSSALTSSLATLIHYPGNISDMLKACLRIILERTNTDVAVIFNYNDVTQQFNTLANLGNTQECQLSVTVEAVHDSYFCCNQTVVDAREAQFGIQNLVGTPYFAGYYDNHEELGLVLGNHVVSQRGKLTFGLDDQVVISSAVDIIGIILKHREILGSSMITADLFESLSSDCRQNIDAINTARHSLLSNALSQAQLNSSPILDSKSEVVSKSVQQLHSVIDGINWESDDITESDLLEQFNIPLNAQELGVFNTLNKAYSLEQARQLASDQLEVSNRMLAATRAISQLITQQHGIDELLQKTCQEFVNSGVFTDTYIWREREVVPGEDEQVYHANTHGGVFDTDLCKPCIDFIADAPMVKYDVSCVVCQQRTTIKTFHHYTAIHYNGVIYGVLSGTMEHQVNKDDDLKRLLAEVAEELGYALYSLTREQAHRAQDLELKLILEAANVGTWSYDMEADLGYRSPQISEYLGYSDSQTRFSEKSWKRNIHPDDLALVLTQMTHHLNGNSDCYEVEYRVKNSDSQWHWVIDRGSVIERDSDGEPRVLCGTQGDINERKLAEQEQALMVSKLNQSQKLESIGRLAGGVAHDFNNLLSVISGFSELLLMDHNHQNGSREKLLTIKQACERAKNLTTQLLMFSRKQSIQPKVVEWNQMIMGSLNVYRRLIEENIEVEFEIGESLPNILADPQQLDQILANLLVNARDAVLLVKDPEQKPKIHITTHTMYFPNPAAIESNSGNHFVCLVVSDNGVGMSDEVKSHIFEPFYSTKGLSKGTGLGLATVFSIIEQNQGFIEVDSDVDMGTTFTVYWPVSDQPVTKTVDEKKLDGLTGSGEHILVVEDELKIREYCRDVLERFNYRVSLASSAEEAMHSMVGGDQPDVLVTDVVLPEKSGYQLAEETTQLWPDMPVLYCSGYTDDILAHHGVLDPEVNLLNKPFDSRELLYAIKRLLMSNTNDLEDKEKQSESLS